MIGWLARTFLIREDSSESTIERLTLPTLRVWNAPERIPTPILLSLPGSERLRPVIACARWWSVGFPSMWAAPENPTASIPFVVMRKIDLFAADSQTEIPSPVFRVNKRSPT